MTIFNKGRHFDREVIILRVRWYLRYKLSLRDLVEMMSERGLSLAHTTIMRWVKRFTPEFLKRSVQPDETAPQRYHFARCRDGGTLSSLSCTASGPLCVGLLYLH